VAGVEPAAKLIGLVRRIRGLPLGDPLMTLLLLWRNTGEG
jgi:hypothetical protein